MAKSKDIKKWITINGNHVPVYEDGSLGGIGAKLSGKKAGRGPRPAEKGSKQDRMHSIIKEVQSKYGDDDDGFAEEIRNQIIEDNGEDLSDDEIRELAAQYYDEEDDGWQDRDYDEFEDEDDPDVIARNNEDYKANVKKSAKDYVKQSLDEVYDQTGARMTKEEMMDWLEDHDDHTLKELGIDKDTLRDAIEEHYGEDKGSKNFPADVDITREKQREENIRALEEAKAKEEGFVSVEDMKAYYEEMDRADKAAESGSKSTSQSRGYEEFGEDIGTRISFGSDENGENDKVGKIESFSEDGKIATVRTNDGKAYHINSDGEIIDEVKPAESNDSLKSYPGVKNFGNGPDGYEYGKYMDAIKESNDFEYKTVAGKDMPAIIDSLKEGDSLTVHHDGLRGIGAHDTYTKTKDGIEYATSSSFLAGKTLSEDEAKHYVKNSVDNVITITRPKKSIKVDDKEVGVNKSPRLTSNKDDMYLNRKMDYEFGDSLRGRINSDTGEGTAEYKLDKTHTTDNYERKIKRLSKEYPDYDITGKEVEDMDGHKSYAITSKIKVGDKQVGVSKDPHAAEKNMLAERGRIPSKHEFEKDGTYYMSTGKGKKPVVFDYTSKSLGKTEGIPGSEYDVHLFRDAKDPSKKYYIHEDELLKDEGYITPRKSRQKSIKVGDKEVSVSKSKGGSGSLSNMSASQIQDLISNIRSGDSQSKYSISELQAELRKRKK